MTHSDYFSQVESLTSLFVSYAVDPRHPASGRGPALMERRGIPREDKAPSPIGTVTYASPVSRRAVSSVSSATTAAFSAPAARVLSR